MVQRWWLLLRCLRSPPRTWSSPQWRTPLHCKIVVTLRWRSIFVVQSITTHSTTMIVADLQRCAQTSCKEMPQNIKEVPPCRIGEWLSLFINSSPYSYYYDLLILHVKPSRLLLFLHFFYLQWFSMIFMSIHKFHAKCPPFINYFPLITFHPIKFHPIKFCLLFTRFYTFKLDLIA